MRSLIFLLLAFLGALAMANPVDNIVSAINATAQDNTNTASAQATCDDCKNYFNNCYKGILCWINPAACFASCKIETCRQYDGYCKANCGWDDC
ncbi:hypothetical protein T440DRAFT_472678 [Plenodomus tracheiphilus IPT5]|uniref:Uncharacterized protein n=1 Tax=Plenodomus tracheiphilus IPT5 TaxID=1408161 RepID=A0A6A7ATC8_9PLEO|nr:hypothetical protein T440DRAFT_472678 [Plenodomus tracheiphilus IPT5]